MNDKEITIWDDPDEIHLTPDQIREMWDRIMPKSIGDPKRVIITSTSVKLIEDDTHTH